MSTDTVQPSETAPWVTIIGKPKEHSFGPKFRIIEAKLKYRRADASMSSEMTRINFARGDSVGVLLYNPETDAVILVRQFRYPVFASLSPGDQGGEGAKKAWILELVAGMVDSGQTVIRTVHKELLEETGYEVVGPLGSIGIIYPSPGGTSERIHILVAEVDHSDRIGTGGGIVEEGEDIEVVEFSFQTAMDMVADGEICDAKTIIALQHLALRHLGAGRDTAR